MSRARGTVFVLDGDPPGREAVDAAHALHDDAPPGTAIELSTGQVLTYVGSLDEGNGVIAIDVTTVLTAAGALLLCGERERTEELARAFCEVVGWKITGVPYRIADEHARPAGAVWFVQDTPQAGLTFARTPDTSAALRLLSRTISPARPTARTVAFGLVARIVRKPCYDANVATTHAALHQTIRDYARLRFRA